MHSIPIVLAADENYAPFMYVTITSCLEAKLKPTRYVFYILVSKTFSNSARKEFLLLENKYSNCHIHFINMQGMFDSAYISTCRLSAPTYYRLMMAGILNDYDKAIYLDCDVIVCEDLTNYYSIDISEYYIAGVQAIAYQLKHGYSELYNEYGLPDLRSYINAGVTLWNLKKIREDDKEKELISLSSKQFKSQDQDIINIAFYPAIKLIPLKYNMMTIHVQQLQNPDEHPHFVTVYGKDNIQEALKSPSIIHYVERHKPWHNSAVLFADLWWKAAEKLPSSFEIHSKHGNFSKEHFMAELCGNFCQLDEKLCATNRDLRMLHADTKKIKNTTLALKKSLEENVTNKHKLISLTLNKFNRFRLEICFTGEIETSVILGSSKTLEESTPSWLNKNSYGKLLIGNTGKYSIRILPKTQGKLTLRFRGCDYKDKTHRIPVWVDFTSIKVNGLDYGTHSVWHDQPYVIQRHIQENDELLLEIETEPHLHSDDELSHIVISMNPQLGGTSDISTEICEEIQRKMYAMRGITLPSVYTEALRLQTQLLECFTKHENLHNGLYTLRKNAESLHREVQDNQKQLENVETQLLNKGLLIKNLNHQISITQKQTEKNSCAESELRRFLQLSFMMPKLTLSYRLLQIKSSLSLGKARERSKEKLQKLKKTIREYRYLKSLIIDS